MSMHAGLMQTHQHAVTACVKTLRTDCSGETRLALHVPSSSSGRYCYNYHYHYYCGQSARPQLDKSCNNIGGLAVTAGGTSLCVWDIMAGGRLLHRLSQHQKTVTCVALSPLAGPDSAAAPRMLSGSLDGHVKVCDMPEEIPACCHAIHEPIHGVLRLSCAGTTPFA